MINPKHDITDVAHEVARELAQELPKHDPRLARQRAMDEALVIPGCADLPQFLQEAQLLATWPEQPEALALQAKKVEKREALGSSSMLACHPGDPGKVLVIRGFENLLHYLDWLDTIHPAH